MSIPHLPSEGPIPARAINLSDRLDTRPLRRPEALAFEPLTLPVAGGGLAVLFRYGVVVLFGVSSEAEVAFLRDLSPHLVGPAPVNDREETTLLRRPEAASEGPEQGGVALVEFTLERLLVVAEVLARSAALAALEARVAHAFDRAEPMTAALAEGGRLSAQSRDMVRHIGKALQAEHALTARVQASEKPDLLWDRPALEGLFLRLESEYELQDRREALDRRVELLGRTAETVLGLLQHRASLRVEWYIVLLIVFELLVTFGQYLVQILGK